MLWIALNSILGGVLLGFLTPWTYRRLPAAWLCDYGEDPTKLTEKQRTCSKWSVVLFSVIYTVVIFQFQYRYTPIFAAVFTLYTTILMLVLLADLKTLIIPDQLVIMLAVIGLGVVIADLVSAQPLFHHTWWSPLVGAGIGFLFFFLIGLIGSLIVKKESVGFGDCKLLAAIGLCVGTKGILIVLGLTLLTAVLSFVVLMLAKKLKRGEATAFAPYICVSTILFFLFSKEIDALLQAYWSLITMS